MCASLRLFKMSFISRLKRQKMKVAENLWNIKTETGQIVRADKIGSFSKRFFPNFRCLSLTVEWLNAKRKCWSNGKRSDHSTRDSSSPFLSFSFHVRPMKESRESGFWNSRNFVCEIWNPGLWNPEYRARNADYTNDYNPESKVPGHRIWNPVPAVRNPERGIPNPKSSWIRRPFPTKAGNEEQYVELKKLNDVFPSNFPL